MGGQLAGDGEFHAYWVTGAGLSDAPLAWSWRRRGKNLIVEVPKVTLIVFAAVF